MLQLSPGNHEKNMLHQGSGMCCQDGYGAFIHKTLCMTCFKHVPEHGMISWNDDQHINMLIYGKCVNCFVEIIGADKIKFRPELLEHFQ